MSAPKDTFAELVERAIACGRRTTCPPWLGRACPPSQHFGMGPTSRCRRESQPRPLPPFWFCTRRPPHRRPLHLAQTCPLGGLALGRPSPRHWRQRPLPKISGLLATDNLVDLPGTLLKEAFPFALLTGAVAVRGPTEHFSLDSTTHVADVLVLACWFMLREIERAHSCWRPRGYPSHCTVLGEVVL